MTVFPRTSGIKLNANEKDERFKYVDDKQHSLTAKIERIKEDFKSNFRKQEEMETRFMNFWAMHNKFQKGGSLYLRQSTRSQWSTNTVAKDWKYQTNLNWIERMDIKLSGMIKWNENNGKVNEQVDYWKVNKVCGKLLFDHHEENKVPRSAQFMRKKDTIIQITEI